MADYGTATPIPTSAFIVATGYDPVGARTAEVEPVRYALRDGVWVPIQ